MCIFRMFEGSFSLDVAQNFFNSFYYFPGKRITCNKSIEMLTDLQFTVIAP